MIRPTFAVRRRLALTDETVAALGPMLNPVLIPMAEALPGGLRAALTNQLAPLMTEALAEGPAIEVYTQTRSILGSVRHLYLVGSTIAAALILLFSVIVPFTKAVLVLWAVLRRPGAPGADVGVRRDHRQVRGIGHRSLRPSRRGDTAAAGHRAKRGPGLRASIAGREARGAPGP